MPKNLACQMQLNEEIPSWRIRRSLLLFLQMMMMAIQNDWETHAMRGVGSEVESISQPYQWVTF